MREISVGFSKPRKWKPYAWLIRFLYRIPFDHVYVLVDSAEFDRFVIFQSSRLWVNAVGNRAFLADNQIVDLFTFQVSDEAYKDICQFSIDNLGKPYGVFQAFGLGLVQICAMIRVKIKNPFRFSGNYVCSEFCGAALQRDGILEQEEVSLMSPLEVYRAVKAASLKGAHG